MKSIGQKKGHHKKPNLLLRFWFWFLICRKKWSRKVVVVSAWCVLALQLTFLKQTLDTFWLNLFCFCFKCPTNDWKKRTWANWQAVKENYIGNVVELYQCVFLLPSISFLTKLDLNKVCLCENSKCYIKNI